MNSKRRLNNNSSHKRDELITKIVNLNRRIYNYKNLVAKKLIIKRYIFIVISILICTIYLLSYFDVITLNEFWKFGDNEFFVFLSVFPLIPISIWVIWKLKPRPLLIDYKLCNLAQLRNEIRDLKQMENNLFEVGVKQKTRHFPIIIVFLVMLIYSIIKNEYFFAFNFTLLFTFRIGSLIASPINHRKFYKIQLKTKIIILTTYLNCLDGSKINPRNLI